MKGYFSNWGNYPTVSGELHIFKTPDDLSSMLKQFHEAIPRGMGRSYGDSSLAEHMISNVCYKKVISFDAHKGTIHAQSGISLSEILELIMPKGWFLSVTPGTKFVSLGGAIAADVHGKNHHHVGSFCEHVEFIEIMNAQGEIQHCSSTENKELFEASCGGMGLTGIIVSASKSRRIKKIIYDGKLGEPVLGKEVKAISNYLTENKNFFIDKRNAPISNIPKANFGCMPNDGGGLIFSKEEKDRLINNFPELLDHIKIYSIQSPPPAELQLLNN